MAGIARTHVDSYPVRQSRPSRRDIWLCGTKRSLRLNDVELGLRKWYLLSEETGSPNMNGCCDPEE